jgi:hypothetical protein
MRMALPQTVATRSAWRSVTDFHDHASRRVLHMGREGSVMVWWLGPMGTAEPVLTGSPVLT